MRALLPFPLLVALAATSGAAQSTGTARPETASPAGWIDCIGEGLAGWRSPGAWVQVGSARPDPEDPRRLATGPGRGVLCNGNEPTGNLLTEASFGDVEVHVEFMVPKGSNSGVYFQGRYEIQILDSHGKADPGFGDCGGIYQRWEGGRGFEGRAPRRNASRKPGEWQTFDVVFRAPRFAADGTRTAAARFERVVHNGVLVHEDVELTGPTRAAAFADEQPVGPLMFQGDHGPVAFRAIRVRRLDGGSRPWLPTDQHRRETLEGFTLLVDPRLAGTGLHEATFRELGSQLYRITRAVPAAALAKLRQVTIYVEQRSGTRCMAYHPSREWLTRNGFNPEMAKCVELGNPKVFLDWTRTQPWMVLHELAHAYHDRFLDRGFRNRELGACYRAARQAGTYDSVLHVDGQKVRAYALTDPKEYFAEASEAYFGTNDMYPFVRSELRVHDPKLFELLGRLWGR